LFCALLYFFYSTARGSTENFLFISVWLFFGPLFISAFIGVFLIQFASGIITSIGDGTFVFFAIPIISLIYSLVFKKLDGFYDKLKVSLKINNIIIVCITFGFLWYAYSIEDFSQLIPSINELQEHNIGPREFIFFMLQIVTFPYIISNLIVDAAIEIIEFNRKKQKNIEG
jgi:hypothetical protein